jgi:hypothetical protein
LNVSLAVVQVRPHDKTAKNVRWMTIAPQCDSLNERVPMA